MAPILPPRRSVSRVTRQKNQQNMNDLKSLSIELSEFIKQSTTENALERFKKHIEALSDLVTLECVRIPDGKSN